MIDFLIMYEVKSRELESIVLLARELRARGYSVDFLSFDNTGINMYFQNRGLLKKYKNNVRVVLTPSLYHDEEMYQLVYYVCGKCENVVNLRWEQVFSMKSQFDYDSYFYPHDDAKLAYHVCWGKMPYRNLLECGVPEDNLLLTGPMQMDFLKVPLNNYYMSRDDLLSRYNIDIRKKVLLYISSFVLASITERQFNVEKDILGEEYYNNKRLSDARESFLTTLEWLEQTLQDENTYVIYRPHPSEHESAELFALSKKYQNFLIVSDFSVKQWILASDVVVTWKSTSIAEAFFANTPCIIARPVPFEDGEDMSTYENADFVTAYEDYREKATGQLQFSVSSEIIKSYYDVTDTPSYVRLCDELEGIIKSDHRFPWNEQKINQYNQIKKKFMIKSVMIYIYVPLMLYIGKQRSKHNLNFGNYINTRADRLFLDGQLTNIKSASPSEINAIYKKLDHILNEDV